LGLTRAHEEIAASQMDFGVEIFKSLAEQKEMENFLVSPFSLSLDLAMLASGAEGMTYQELVKGLGFEDIPHSSLASIILLLSKMTALIPIRLSKRPMQLGLIWAFQPM